MSINSILDIILGYSKSRTSPIEVEVACIVPAGNSTTDWAFRYMPLILKGETLCRIFTTRLSLSRNSTSMAKAIKKVCMELQGLRTMASPCLRRALPNSPFILLKSACAITASSAKQMFLVILRILMKS